MYKNEELAVKNTKQLLEIAKELQIVGRHKMRKEQLVDAILVNAVEKGEKKDLEKSLAQEAKPVWEQSQYKQNCRIDIKPKQFYIDNAKVGTIVAFKMNMDRNKAFSGKIKEIHENSFLIETKNGVRYRMNKSNIIWVKTTARWPNGVLAALKGERYFVKGTG